MLRTNRLLAAILIVQFMMGLASALNTQLWLLHEPDQYNVVRFLINHGRLPTENDYPADDAANLQATQPPLYFLVAAPIVALLDDHQPVPPGTQPDLLCLGGEADNSTQMTYASTPGYDWPLSGTVSA